MIRHHILFAFISHIHSEETKVIFNHEATTGTYTDSPPQKNADICRLSQQQDCSDTLQQLMIPSKVTALLAKVGQVWINGKVSRICKSSIVVHEVSSH